MFLCVFAWDVLVVFRLKPLTLIKKYVSKPKLKPAFSDCDVQRIMEIGYTRDVSICALEACHGDVNQACDTLLEYGLVWYQLHC